jgi:endonuclease-3 related protein
MSPLHIYEKLLKFYGKQYWWPAETRFEVIIGAFLTQQTNWKNVETVIKNLKNEDLLNPKSLATATVKNIEKLIKKSGFYRQKARRIINFSKFLILRYDGSLKKFFSKNIRQIREELLSQEGIGPETADSILLYAAGKLSFPIDAYTIRLFNRLGINENEYYKLKSFFENNLPRDLEIYQEYHALIDIIGKTYCKADPICLDCPLISECEFFLKKKNEKIL